MDRIKLYLAGGMTGIKFEEYYEWRAEIERILDEASEAYYIKYANTCFNPADHYNFHTKTEYDTEKEVMEYDLNNLRKSDYVVCNFNVPESLGTMSELAIAYDRRIPIYGIAKDPHLLHPWQYEMVTKFFPSIEDFCDYYINNIML